MDKEKLKKLRRSDFFKAVFLIIFVFVTGWVIFGFTRVYGSAMKPAACDGDILMYYRLHTEYKAGDMVVYQADGLLHIGRIAAVPEETVQITEEGELVINGYTQADTEVNGGQQKLWTDLAEADQRHCGYADPQKKSVEGNPWFLAGSC